MASVFVFTKRRQSRPLGQMKEFLSQAIHARHLTDNVEVVTEFASPVTFKHLDRDMCHSDRYWQFLFFVSCHAVVRILN